jgi:hypothetical protein
MQSIMLLGFLVVLLTACLPSSLAGVLPTTGSRSAETFRIQRKALEEAAKTLDVEDDDILLRKNVAEYMINELKKKTPHGGELFLFF